MEEIEGYNLNYFRVTSVSRVPPEHGSDSNKHDEDSNNLDGYKSGKKKIKSTGLRDKNFSTLDVFEDLPDNDLKDVEVAVQDLEITKDKIEEKLRAIQPNVGSIIEFKNKVSETF